jgi:hypothetical protein
LQINGLKQYEKVANTSSNATSKSKTTSNWSSLSPADRIRLKCKKELKDLTTRVCNEKGESLTIEV